VVNYNTVHTYIRCFFVAVNLKAKFYTATIFCIVKKYGYSKCRFFGGRCGMLPFLTKCLKEKFFNVSRYKFACPPCCCYWLQEIKTHEVHVIPSGITFLSDFIKTKIFDRFSKKNTQMPNFMKIRPLGCELFHADGRTDGQRHWHDEANSRFS